MNHLRYYRLARREFHLLEVLIAMFLLVTCAVPALQIYTSLNATQTEFRKQIQKDHLVHRIHAKLIEQFYQEDIFQEALQSGRGAIPPDFHKELTKLNCRGYFDIAINFPESEEGKIKGKKCIAELAIHLLDESKEAQDDAELKHAVYRYAVYFEHYEIKGIIG